MEKADLKVKYVNIVALIYLCNIAHNLHTALGLSWVCMSTECTLLQLSPCLHFIRKLKVRFQELPEPNRACLVGVYAVTLDPLLSLYGIIYMTWYTRLLPKATSVTFR